MWCTFKSHAAVHLQNNALLATAAGAWSVVALPAIQPGQAGWVLSTQSLTLTVPLWLLVVAFCTGLGLKGKQLVRSYGGTHHWSKVGRQAVPACSRLLHSACLLAVVCKVFGRVPHNQMLHKASCPCGARLPVAMHIEVAAC